MADLLRSAADGDATTVALLAAAFVGAVVFFSAAAFIAGGAAQRRRILGSLGRRIRRERKEAVRMSRAVIGGQVAEQVAPFLPGFPCSPADVRFVGKPIDFVGFPGAGEGRPIREVLLIEVKTGGSQLSEREREIKAAVDAGRVRYVVWRADSAASEGGRR